MILTPSWRAAPSAENTVWTPSTEAERLMHTSLNSKDLAAIRRIVPQLDSAAIRSLKQLGFDLLRSEDISRREPTTPLKLLLARGVTKGL